MLHARLTSVELENVPQIAISDLCIQKCMCSLEFEHIYGRLQEPSHTFAHGGSLINLRVCTSRASMLDCTSQTFGYTLPETVANRALPTDIEKLR